MSRYILDPGIALRSWRLVPYAYYIKGVREAKGLKKDEFELLERCDGINDLWETDSGSAAFEKLSRMGFILPAKEGDALSEWQKPLRCDNRYFPAMNWMITGKCNYNCLHCFNAADNSPLMSEWSLEDAKTLIAQAQKCGINAFTITGGEPMLHKDFFEIAGCIYEHGMYIDELNTNGYFINREALDRFRAIGCDPLIKISFDGVGHHDWLRGHRGAEEKALDAIRLCVENGFRVKVQTNVHRLNADTMLPTAKLLDEMGVCEMRIIRTSESLRWRENAGDACLGIEEYYDKMLEFASGYKKDLHGMIIDIWQFLVLYPRQKSYRIRPVEYKSGEYRDSLPVCRGNRGMPAVTADGSVYPCMQMSGYFAAKGLSWGNVKENALQPLLQRSAYIDEVCYTVGQLKNENKKCAACRYFKHCAGGCRALAIALTGSTTESDPTKCIFFEKGYLKKVGAIMDGWYDTAPIETE